MLSVGCSDGSLWVVSIDNESIPMQCLTKKGWSPVADIIVRSEMCPVITDELRERIKKEGESILQRKATESDVTDSTPSTPKGVKEESSILSVSTQTTSTGQASANLIDEEAREVEKAEDADAASKEDKPFEMRPRTLLLMCMEGGVICLELTWDTMGAIKAREAYVSPKYPNNFCSFAIVNSVTEKGIFLAGVDPNLQCVAWNLYQMAEIKKMNLAPLFRVKNTKLSTRPTIVSNGSIYAFCAEKRIGVCTIQPGSTQHTLQYAEDVAEVNTQEPAKLRLTQRWTTLGLPLGQSLNHCF